MDSKRTWLFGLIVLCCVAQRSQVAGQVTVSGQVNGPDPAALTGASLRFEQQDQLFAADTVDEAGRYGVRLRPGAYDLSIAVPPGQSFGLWGRHRLELDKTTNLNVAFAASIDRQVRSGRLVDGAGRAIARATVSTVGGYYAAAQTDEAGHFVIYGSAEAHGWRVSCTSYDDCLGARERERFISVNYPLDPTPGPITDVELVMDYRTLTGVVLDETGAPVAGALVTWGQGNDPAQLPARGEASATIRTDAEGRFEVQVLAGLGYLAVVPQHSDLYVNDYRTVTIDAADAEPPSVTVRLMLKALETIAGTIVDRAGQPLANLTLTVDSQYETSTNQSGQFEVRAPPSSRTLAVRCSAGHCPPESGDENFSIQLSYTVDLTQGPVHDQVITIDVRTLTGTLTDNCGVPMAGTRVRWQQDTVTDVPQAHAHDIALTDEQGMFRLNVFPGEGTLQVEADASMFVPATRRIIISSEQVKPEPVSIELEPAIPVELVANTGRVVDSRGRGIANAYVSQGEHAIGVSTDETGAFELLTPPGVSTFLALRCRSLSGCLADFDQDLTIWHAWPENAFGTAPVRDARLAIDARTARVDVIDSDGVPVPDVRFIWSQSVAPDREDGVLGQIQNNFTSQTGKASFTVIRGVDGWMAVETERDRRWVYVQHDLVDEPDFLVIFPIVVDAASARVVRGETVSTAAPDSSPTVDDPIETSVRVTRAGVASIHEHPFSTAAPAGYRYLAQEVALTAPNASADDPLIIQLILHASRSPDAANDSRLVVFHEQERISACESAEGAASPDPCLYERNRLRDGAIALTVKSSRAGTWIVGMDLTDQTEPTPSAAMRGAAGGGAESLPRTYRRIASALSRPTAASSTHSDGGTFACNVAPGHKSKTLPLLLLHLCCAAMLVLFAKRAKR